MVYILLIIFALYEMSKVVLAGHYLRFKSYNLSDVDKEDKMVFSLAVVSWGLFRLFYLFTILYLIKSSEYYIFYTIILIFQIIYGKLTSSFLKLLSFSTRITIERFYSLIMTLLLFQLFYLELH